VSVCLSVCVSFCEQDYWKSNEPVWLMGLPIGRTDLTFVGVPVPDTYFGSIFHFLHRCRMGILEDLLAFLIQSLPDFCETWRSDWCRQGNESTTFWERCSGHLDLSGYPDSHSGSFFGWHLGIDVGLHFWHLGIGVGLHFWHLGIGVGLHFWHLGIGVGLHFWAQSCFTCTTTFAFCFLTISCQRWN